MKEKNKVTEYDQWESWSQGTYRTGGTQPPKNNGGVIAFLLVLVIFLCGVSTALGLMNIRLFQQLTAAHEPETPPVSFSRVDPLTPAEDSSPLGITGQTVPDFWQNYHHLPKGVYVTQVLSGSDACAQGIRPGDILLRVDQTDVPDTDTLQQLLQQKAPGSQVTLDIYRGGECLAFTVILQE